MRTALDDAADEIAALHGYNDWDYPAQLVRWTKEALNERADLRQRVRELEISLAVADELRALLASAERVVEAARRHVDGERPPLHFDETAYLYDALRAHDAQDSSGGVAETASTGGSTGAVALPEPAGDLAAIRAAVWREAAEWCDTFAAAADHVGSRSGRVVAQHAADHFWGLANKETSDG